MHPISRVLLKNPAKPGKSWLILIHGLGMSHKSWTAPFTERLLNGRLSFDYVLTDSSIRPRSARIPWLRFLTYSSPLRISADPPTSFWDSFQENGNGLLTWNQKDPKKGVCCAVDELEKVLENVPYEDKKVLIGHSRGGLIARRYLQERRPGWDRVTGVVLMGVPHRGTQIAKFTDVFRFLRLVGNRKDAGKAREHGGSFGNLLQSLAGYADHAGIEELIPRSPFLQSLDQNAELERALKIPYLNLIGTRTDFLRIYLGTSPQTKPKQVFSLLDGFEKMLPKSLVPPEIRQGRGDGLVSVKSAYLPWAASNQFFPVNHAQFLVDMEVRNKIRQFIKDI